MNVLSVILIIILIALIVFLWYTSRALFRNLYPTFAGGGIYVPTPDEAIKTMLELAGIQPIDIVTDLGSGDGRLLIAAAKAGAKYCTGYEIQSWLVKMANESATKESVSDNVQTLKKSMWDADVSNTTLVLLYQISYAMKGIEEKLQKELPPGARVVANGFKFPNWKEEKVVGNVRLYRKT